ncbi:hypothetical protein ACQP1G_17630 [Nocardia sp. CA-107356]|uniref:hypothetical protein n=1 Tax=Nocardia sp. CA-107356 TaxID=3239972 RepID=UPI003D922878
MTMTVTRVPSPPVWRNRAALTLRYARGAHIPRGQVTEVTGALATVAMQTAHAVLAARGEWTTNEKRLLRRAGLRGVDTIVAGLRPEPTALVEAIVETEALFRTALADPSFESA